MAATDVISQQAAEEHLLPTPAKRQSSRALIISVAAIVAVFLVGVGGLWVYTRILDPPTVAPGRILPVNTLAYITIDTATQGSQRKAFDDLAQTFAAQPELDQAWAELTEQVSNTLHIDKSFAGFPDLVALDSYIGGNLTIALLPASTNDLEKLRDRALGDDTPIFEDMLKHNVVGLVDLHLNPFDKKARITDIMSQTEGSTRLIPAGKYKDIEINRYVTGTLTLYISLLPSTATAVVAESIDPVRLVIDQFKGDNGLKYDPTYKALLGALPSERVAALYFNLTEISRQAQFMGTGPSGNTPQGGSGAWMVALGLQPDGLQLNVVAQTESRDVGKFLFNAPGTELQLNPNARPQVSSLYDVPADSFAFLVGTDLKSVTERALDSFQGNDLHNEAQIEADINKNTGLDLRHDILPLLSGDFILSLSPPGAPDTAQPSIIGQLKLSPDNHAKAAQLIPNLLDRLSNGRAVAVSQNTGNSFYSMPGTKGAVIGLASERLIFVQAEDQAKAVEQAGSVARNTGKGFAGTAKWKAISKHLPVDSNIIAYLDAQAVQEMADRNMTSEQRQGYKHFAPFLRPLRYLLLGAANYANIASKEYQPPSKLRSHTVLFLGIDR